MRSGGSFAPALPGERSPTAYRRRDRQPQTPQHARERVPSQERRCQAQEGSKIHITVDTLGHLLALHVTPADQRDRTQVNCTTKAVPRATGRNVELACVEQGFTGEQVEDVADDHGIALHILKRPEAKRGFVLLSRRWVVERSFAWEAPFRRLA